MIECEEANAEAVVQDLVSGRSSISHFSKAASADDHNKVRSTIRNILERNPNENGNISDMVVDKFKKTQSFVKNVDKDAIKGRIHRTQGFVKNMDKTVIREKFNRTQNYVQNVDRNKIRKTLLQMHDKPNILPKKYTTFIKEIPIVANKKRGVVRRRWKTKKQYRDFEK